MKINSLFYKASLRLPSCNTNTWLMSDFSGGVHSVASILVRFSGLMITSFASPFPPITLRRGETLTYKGSSASPPSSESLRRKNENQVFSSLQMYFLWLPIMMMMMIKDMYTILMNIVKHDWLEIIQNWKLGENHNNEDKFIQFQ